MKFTPIEVIFNVQSNKKGTGFQITPVQPLVRCKNCKYNEGGFCDEVMDGKGVEDEWFCFCGERRTHDTAGT